MHSAKPVLKLATSFCLSCMPSMHRIASCFVQSMWHIAAGTWGNNADACAHMQKACVVSLCYLILHSMRQLASCLNGSCAHRNGFSTWHRFLKQTTQAPVELVGPQVLCWKKKRTPILLQVMIAQSTKRLVMVCLPGQWDCSPGFQKHPATTPRHQLHFGAWSLAVCVVDHPEIQHCQRFVVCVVMQRHKSLQLSSCTVTTDA